MASIGYEILRTSVEAAHTLAMQQRLEDLITAVQVFHSRPDASDVVRNWHKPLVVIGGDADGFVTVDKSTRIAASAPRGRLHIIRDCGHLVNMEYPAAFNAILDGLVRSTITTA